jgi:hypothetical protein
MDNNQPRNPLIHDQHVPSTFQTERHQIIPTPNGPQIHSAQPGNPLSQQGSSEFQTGKGHQIFHTQNGPKIDFSQQGNPFQSEKSHQIFHTQNGPKIDFSQPGNPFSQQGSSAFQSEKSHQIFHTQNGPKIDFSQPGNPFSQQGSSAVQTEKSQQIFHTQNGPRIDITQPGNPVLHGSHGTSIFNGQQDNPVIRRIQESQSIHGQQGLQTVQQKEHKAFQGQEAIKDSQGLPVVEGHQGHNTMEIHNIHTPIQQNHQIHQTGSSHSFSTGNVAGPIFSTNHNSPNQILKPISTANTDQIMKNHANSILKSQSFRRGLFPRNFILPERHRKHLSFQGDANDMFQTNFGVNEHSASGHNFVQTHDSQTPARAENAQERNANTKSSSQKNGFGFGSLDNPHFRDVSFHHGGILNATSFLESLQFGDRFSQKDNEVNEVDLMISIRI